MAAGTRAAWGSDRPQVAGRSGHDGWNGRRRSRADPWQFIQARATGTATLNADAFNLAGLNELSLGTVALGGSGATITEFSTDPFFTADADTVIPTQRAIKAYISSQIGGGSGSLNVNTVTAGSIYIAGDTITTTTLGQININTKVNFTGGVDGYPVALNLFLQA